ncbi:MAG: MFS transporter [Legionellaceae bacterium]|nr:MFS transporter [Legionellaceae bacterium]
MIKKDSRSAWFVWALGATFFFFEYIIRVSPGALVKDLSHTFSINAYQLGFLSTAFSMSYIAMQIPVGSLVDKYNIRWLVGSMALLCAFSTILFASTETYALAVLARFLIGITGAFAFVGALKLAALFFSPKHFGFLAGTTQALGMLGASIGVGPLAGVTSVMGWRETLTAIGLFILLLSALILATLRTRAASTHPKEETLSVWQGMKLLLKNRYIWLNMLVIGLLYTPSMVFAELWGPLYITRVYDFSPVFAASVVSIIFIGWGIGSPIMGWLSDRLQRRKPIILSSILLSMLFMAMMLYLPLSPSMLFVVAFLYGMSNVGVSICYASACELAPQAYTGTALGLTNMASIILGALFQPLVGFLLDLQWDGQLVNGVRYYSAANLKNAMIALPICFILCLIACLLSKETYPSTAQNQH